MIKIKSTLSTAILTSSLAGPALAHSGHDHGHWSSSWLHLGLAASVVAGVLLLRFAIKRARKTKN